ncbi:MAG: YihY/virulence factor BrkB family protein [Stappiaceae bacterium]
MNMRALRSFRIVLMDAFGHFDRDDGWVVASHVAMSSLMALFPFLIFVTALAGVLGVGADPDQLTDLILDTLPREVGEPLATEVHDVLTVPRTDLLTFGIITGVVIASNGIEALRTALNRAYRVKEDRSFIFRRLQSIFLVIIGAATFIAFSFLIVLGPLIWAGAVKWFPDLGTYADSFNFLRIALAVVIIVLGLLISHRILPAGKRKVFDTFPGIVVTLVLWVLAGSVFGAYLERFATYVSTYAGLAGVMTALVFLYLIAVLFILGGEINAAILRQRRLRSSKQET